MIRRILIFCIALVVLLISVFYLHRNFSDGYHTVLFKSYWVNYLMAIVVYSALVLASKRFNAQLGFLYMGGSFFKFLIYFLVLSPFFKANAIANETAFVMFFVPYGLAMFLETTFLIKLLNASDNEL